MSQILHCTLCGQQIEKHFPSEKRKYCGWECASLARRTPGYMTAMSKLTWDQRNELVELYVTPLPDGTWLGGKELAKRFGITQPAVYNILKKHSIKSRSAKEAHSNGKRCKPVRNLPEGDTPLCKCGCGQYVGWNQRKKRWNAYIIDHYTQEGLQNHRWKDGISFAPYPCNWPLLQRQVRQRERYRCRDCGISAKGFGAPLHVHHLSGNPSSDDMNDLVLLCRNCHAKRHSNAYRQTIQCSS